MKTIRIQKGFDLNIHGKPSKDVTFLEPGRRVGVLPERIPFVKPRLLVKEGDAVQIGSVLYEDKRNTDVKFLSPGGGRVERIQFGRRRVVQEIVIELDSKETYRELEKFSDEDVRRMEPARLIQAFMAGGLWCLFRAFPFGDMPKPDEAPASIIVSLDSKEPFHPLADVYLKDQTALFDFGLKLLSRLTETVYLTATQAEPHTLKALNGSVTHFCQGPYPAGSPGVLLYHIKKTSRENRAWQIEGQDLLLLASLIHNGQYPTARILTVGGSMAHTPGHVAARLGTRVRRLVGAADGSKDARTIAGGLFSGYTSRPDSFVGLRERSLLVVPEGNQKELFGFARPGFDKPSYSKAFLSRFRRSPLKVDCSLHGEERACINCGYCAEVCAVDILPQFAMKSVLAGEVEESLAHGLLDCVSCGLCTYVCPSKIELCGILSRARSEYYKEVG